MTILVDSAIWPWRGRRWAHMVSDTSYDELHTFAVAIGKRRVAFQGDHYDVDEMERARAIAAGAQAVDARVLVRALRSAGLRRRPGHHLEPWRWLAERVAVGHPAALGEVVGSLDPAIAGHVERLGVPLLDEFGQIEVSAFESPIESAAMLVVHDEMVRERARRLADEVLGSHSASWFFAGHGPFVAELLSPVEHPS